MKKVIINHCGIALSFFLLTGCNNGTKDKTSPGTPGDTAITKGKVDTATTSALSKAEKTTTPTANLQDYQYEPAVSIVTGTIQTESFYGPPGFGEYPKTDSQEDVYILTLEKPVNVISTAQKTDEDADTTVNNISKIQLISPDNINMANYKNKQVRLTGTFFGPQTGHHHTNVLLDVQKLEE